jgi:hypothetical protein
MIFRLPIVEMIGYSEPNGVMVQLPESHGFASARARLCLEMKTLATPILSGFPR